MPETTTLRRPSDNPEELKEQLLRELEKLRTQGKNADEPGLFQAYLEFAESLAWEGVARGNLDAPQEVLDLLFAAQPFARRFAPEIEDPVQRAALEVEAVIRSLALAAEALEGVRTEVRLADPRSKTEREILRVLYENREQYLRRGDIFERLGLDITVVRVGQILVHLYHEGLLVRVHGRAQGNPNASFYALSPRGFEICRSLFGPAEAEAPREEHEERTDLSFDQALSTMLDPNVPPRWRSLSAATLASGSYQGSPEALRARLEHWLTQSREPKDEMAEKLLRSIEGTWSYRRSSLSSTASEGEMLDEFIRTVQDILQPSRLEAFKEEGEMEALVDVAVALYPSFRGVSDQSPPDEERAG